MNVNVMRTMKARHVDTETLSLERKKNDRESTKPNGLFIRPPTKKPVTIGYPHYPPYLSVTQISVSYLDTLPGLSHYPILV